MSSSLHSISHFFAAVGGICFLVAWLVFLRTRQGDASGLNQLPAKGIFLFTLVSLLLLLPSQSDLLWWFQHLLLFCAYLLCSFFLLRFCRNEVRKNRKNREELEATKKKLADVLERSSRFYLPSCGQKNCGFGYMQTDITDQKELEYQLRLDQEILENTREAVIITDADGSIVDVNRAYIQITGYERREIVGENPRICKSGHHDQAFYEAMWKALLETGKWSGEIWDRRKNGELYQKWLTINAIYDNSVEAVNYVGIFTDITEKRKVEKQLKSLLFYDPLTNLPNRTFFKELLAQALLNSQFHDEPLVLLCIDLNRFKDINDTLGYKAGDNLLIQVSKRIRSCVRETDTVSRLCADEFMVFLSEVKLKDCVGHLARRLLHVLQQPFHIAGEEVFIDACIGISVSPEDGRDAESLIKNADTAINFSQKRGPGNYQYFRAQMNENLVRRATVERELRHALEHEEFMLYYQPQYALTTNMMPGGNSF
ncbi:MAG: sensor domain-containing diguanylate cyclase [Candidatus Electrothrix sp. AR5]|nr:sensor domain-containing diguanylate cyclase [Candidatus Electrothrix sp. AR5]